MADGAAILAEGQKAVGRMRSIFDLTTEEAYQVVSTELGYALPPLDAVENEDWGRDYVLQCLLRHTPEELAAAEISVSEAEI